MRCNNGQTVNALLFFEKSGPQGDDTRTFNHPTPQIRAKHAIFQEEFDGILGPLSYMSTRLTPSSHIF
jgi:hypothetical protein